ncbi:SLATT domain-containing protein [Idiomarina abyssalis]|uniref:SLATT domain-containing protein n=1 Tax=Idiomarina abyssalis TaxID=86102 RepID=UPI003A936585
MSFSDNIWWTRKARVETEKRLLANSFQSQILLLWYSLFGVGVSIYSLTTNLTSPEAWVTYSVLTLCMSVFISGLSFKERAALIKDSYEALTGLYQQVKESEVETDNTSAKSSDTLKIFQNQYASIMEISENHSDTDFAKAVCIAHCSSNEPFDSSSGLKKNLSKAPTNYMKFLVAIWYFKRFLLLTILYITPILLGFYLDFR